MLLQFSLPHRQSSLCCCVSSSGNDVVQALNARPVLVLLHMEREPFTAFAMATYDAILTHQQSTTLITLAGGLFQPSRPN